MNFFLKRFSIRFNQSIQGFIILLDDTSEYAFAIELCARGAENPEEGLEITGTIDIQGKADARPLIGSLTGQDGHVKLAFRFFDNEMAEQRFGARISGSIFSAKAYLEEGFLRRADDEKWGYVKSSKIQTRLSSIRIQQRLKRPVFRERGSRLLKKGPGKIPLRSTAVSLAQAAFPEGRVLAGGGEDTIQRAENIIGRVDVLRRAFGIILFMVERLARLSMGQRFSRASLEDRRWWLERWMNSRSALKRLLLRVALMPLKLFLVLTEEAHERLETVMQYGVAPELTGGSIAEVESIAPEPEETWMKQILPSGSFDRDEVIEADAVIVGTGAGGGPAANVLSERGFAVAIMEAGRFIRRQESTFGTQRITFSLGNTPVLLPMGRAVGGTTFINAGTCFRTPPGILLRWVEQGMPELHPDRMSPYFDQVEETIKVSEADPKYVGPVGEVIRRGADRLGFHSKNLRRNAFECEGKAQCAQGCPHGAKQSTNRSYIPLALKSGASLFTEFKVREILTDGSKAIGVHAYGRGRDGGAVRLTVFARAVVLAAGSLLTPPLIQRSGLVRGNRWIGRNLSFHPATACAAIVPDVKMRTHECIPQGYCVDEFQRDGIMFEGANIPLAVWALMAPGAGKDYMERLERFPNMACFGYMVEDTSRGSVRPGIGDIPLVTYWMNKADLGNLVRGMAILARIFLAAGAEEVFGATTNIFRMCSEDDVARFESRRWRARNFLLSAYHALGTARLGPGPKVSAVDMNHQCHSVPGLFVVDGSAVPSSVGVNPQVTIMAMATRAGERISELLESSA
jgi:choline dehydrogenase-like flavoprotein